MARAHLGQHWDVVLSVPDGTGGEATTDGPIVWASSDETVMMLRDVSADGKTGQIKPITMNAKDADGNEIGVKVTFTADADLGQGTKTLTAETELLFSDADPNSQGQSIVVTLGAPVDDVAAPAPTP